MNRIVLIGNGFDLAHGLKTSYKDFIVWYWKQRFEYHNNSGERITDDGLSKIISPNGSKKTYWGHGDVFYLIAENRIELKPLLANINNEIETKGWVDIENEYYRLLTEYAITDYSTTNIGDLNTQLSILQEKLIEYLSPINQLNIVANNKIIEKIYSKIESSEISVNASGGWRKDMQQDSMLSDKIMLLSFNYTKTAHAYLMEDKQNVELIQIHGKIESPQSIIFGYGDELDGEYEKLKNLNDSECLHNIKSIRYLDADNYRKLLTFVESGPFQICIMGHSCGNSDRTLLNTLFEHKNCVSIKPYYYKKDNGTDNYQELVQNINRCFTDMKSMRAKVVNKEYCEPLV